MKRPDVFDYLNHQTFLKDWLSYLKEEKKIGMRQLASSSGVSTSSISLCLSLFTTLAKCNDKRTC